MDDLLPFDQIAHFSFRQRPIAIPAELRPLFRIGQIVLVINKCCRGAVASAIQLHLFCWALNSQENMNALLGYIANQNTISSIPIHLDPSINRAIQFAIADEFLKVEPSGKIAIAPKGELLYVEIMADLSMFGGEKQFLQKIGKKLTDTTARRMIEGHK